VFAQEIANKTVLADVIDNSTSRKHKPNTNPIMKKNKKNLRVKISLVIFVYQTYRFNFF